MIDLAALALLFERDGAAFAVGVQAVFAFLVFVEEFSGRGEGLSAAAAYFIVGRRI
ncbi:MAG: hypothetical protein HXY40_12915 [Chloroflexi bacterium]|nr:hypothetical protein [Chloroflexota bacterium]